MDKELKIERAWSKILEVENLNSRVTDFAAIFSDFCFDHV